MKRLAVLALFLLVAGTLCGAEFTRDFNAAKAQAAQENKKIFAVFSGSDWCPPCMNLEKKVLSQQKFKNEAEKDFVLVFLDYPKKKKLPDAEQEQNAALQKEYKIRAFPTVIVMDAQGKILKKQEGAPGKTVNGVLKWAKGAR